MTQVIFLGSVIGVGVSIVVGLVFLIKSLWRNHVCCKGYSLRNFGPWFVCNGCHRTFTWDQLTMLEHNKKK